MKMDIKNYLQYYIGHARYRTRLSKNDEWLPWLILTPYAYSCFSNLSIPMEVQLELRPLEDMTEVEKAQRRELMYTGTDGVHAVIIHGESPASFHYLLSHAFDLFDLIPAGLAEVKKQNV